MTEIKAESQVGIGRCRRLPIGTSKCHCKCFYRVCDNDNNKMSMKCHKVPIEPTYPKSNLPRCNQFKNFHINKKMDVALDRLGKSNVKHIRWYSDHYLDTPFKSRVMFQHKDKLCVETFEF